MRTSLILLISLITFKAFTQTSLQQPFTDCKVKGSITIYDYQTKKWIASDMHDSQYPTLPASTFKIINTLIALETEVIKDQHEIIPWITDYDTTKYGHRPDIYHDMSLKEAFEKSAGWAYVELAKKIGKDTYKDYLTRSGYGNIDLSIDDPDFWNFGPFAISPVNQIEILIGVYEETLPFSKRSFKILKEIMITEQQENYTLRSKTGWTRNDGKDTGWWVGYIEKADNVYFFATRLIKDRDESNPDFGKCRKKITRVILQNLDML